MGVLTCPLAQKEAGKLRSELRAFFGDWDFVTGEPGVYAMHMACIMSAVRAYTLQSQGENVFHADAEDQVDCVSPILTVMCIARNDSSDGFLSPEEHKEWALKLMPFLFGTNTNIEDEKKRMLAVANSIEEEDDEDGIYNYDYVATQLREGVRDSMKDRYGIRNRIHDMDIEDFKYWPNDVLDRAIYAALDCIADPAHEQEIVK